MANAGALTRSARRARLDALDGYVRVCSFSSAFEGTEDGR